LKNRSGAHRSHWLNKRFQRLEERWKGALNICQKIKTYFNKILLINKAHLDFWRKFWKFSLMKYTQFCKVIK
jgi:hypothetical protein